MIRAQHTCRTTKEATHGADGHPDRQLLQLRHLFTDPLHLRTRQSKIPDVQPLKRPLVMSQQRPQERRGEVDLVAALHRQALQSGLRRAVKRSGESAIVCVGGALADVDGEVFEGEKRGEAGIEGGWGWGVVSGVDGETETFEGGEIAYGDELEEVDVGDVNAVCDV